MTNDDEMMRLAELKVGKPYECGGKTLLNTAFIDPSKVVAVKAEVMGRMRSVIFLDGGHTLSVDMPPEETARAINALRARISETKKDRDNGR